MLKGIPKLFGALAVISFSIILIGFYTLSNCRVTAVSNYDCISRITLTVLVLILLWIIGIPYIIYRVTKGYGGISKIETASRETNKITSTLQIEIIYWVFGVIIPGSIAVHNFFHPGDSIASRGFRIFTASLFTFIVLLCSKFFWTRIEPPKYNIILFAFITFILFSFSAFLGVYN